MKLIHYSSLLLLLKTAVSAERHTTEALASYRAQFVSSPPLKLDDSKYAALTAIPRNHTLIVLLTALEARFGCQLCRDFQPEWDILAKSSTKHQRKEVESALYGTLDFVDGKSTFQKVPRG